MKRIRMRLLIDWITVPDDVRIEFGDTRDMILDYIISYFRRMAFFTRKDSSSDAWEIVKWWEVRRIPFNFLVGVTGIVTCISIFLVVFIFEKISGQTFDMLPDPPFVLIFGVIFYGIMANVCFTAGWICEILFLRNWGQPTGPFAEMAFLFGTVFSIGLTLLPIVLVALLNFLMIIGHR